MEPFAIAVSGSMVLVSLFLGRDVTATVVLWVPLLVVPLSYSRPPASYSVGADILLIRRAGFLYAASGLAQVILLDEASILGHKNFFVMLAVAVFGASVGSYLTMGIAGAAIAIAFVDYPAATYVVTLVVLGTWSLLLRFPTRQVPVVATSIALLTLGQTRQIAALLERYLAASGKGDNTETRLVLLAQGFAEFRDNPVFGNMLSGDITAEAQIRGAIASVPTHNSYLSLAIAGGALLTVGVVLVWLAALRRVQAMLAERRSDEIPLARFTGVIVVSAMTASLFNAVFESLQTALLIYSAVGLVLAQPLARDASAEIGAKP